MATYKVIQDIEAEDKLLGPLTLRQFIYAIIVVVMGFIAFRLLFVAWWLALPLMPPMLLFTVLAAPFGHDQPSEIWLLAKIRFFLKPRRRIWDQSGVKELVMVTAPKRIERALTKNLSQEEVRSRLQALANTIDSRGWAIKNVNVNMFTQPAYIHQDSDRLIDPSTIPQEVPNFDVGGVEDMFDERSSQTAQHFDQMISASASTRRKELINRIQEGAAGPSAPQTGTASVSQTADYWFMNGSGQQPKAPAGYTAFDHNPLVTPGGRAVTPATDISPEEEKALLARLHAEQEEAAPAYGHMKVIEPLSGNHHKHRRKEKQKEPAKEAAPRTADSTTPPPFADFPDESTHQPDPTEAPHNTPMKPSPDPVILELANNDDLNVATIARQANKMQAEKTDGEVVIKLH